MKADIGKKLKGFRRKNELTIQNFSEQTGISTALLSQLERNMGNPTLSVLETIAEAMETSVSDLLEVEIKNKDLVVRREERKLVFDGDHQLAMYNLVSDQTANSALEMMLITLKPFSETGERFIRHTEEECVFVLKGELTFVFQDEQEEILLREGDTIRILSRRSHMVKNMTDQESVFLNVKNKIRY